jgi:hypothetical protein
MQQAPTCAVAEDEAIVRLINLLEEEPNPEELQRQLRALVPSLRELFRAEVTPQGFYATLRACSPHADPALQALIAEHPALLQMSSRLLALLRAGPWMEDAARLAQRQLARALRHHHEAQIGLLLDAHASDLGGEG